MRNSSIHAAAVVIADRPLTDIVPLQLADRVAVAPDSPNVAGSEIGSVFGAPMSVFCKPLEKPNARNGASVRMGDAGQVPAQPPRHDRRITWLTDLDELLRVEVGARGSTEPVAWTTSELPAWYAGMSPCIACGNAKKLSSAMPRVAVAVLSGRGIAIVGRLV